MNRLLPFVKEGIGEAVCAELAQKPGIEYINELSKRIKLENPQLAAFIGNFAAKYEDSNVIVCCALLVYRMLESQAEADKMEKEIRV